MKSFALVNGDITFNEINDIQIVTGIDEIKQRLEISLSTQLGEWFLNTNLGVDYLRLLPQKNTQQELLDEINEVIESDEAVDSVESSFEFDNSSRKIKIQFEATLIDGQVINSELQEVI